MNGEVIATTLAILALTFLSEDAAVLGAASTVAAGKLPWELGFATCFIGIWAGDIWLYGMARAFGAPFVARFANGPAMRRSQEWFEKRGSLVLVVSRVVPGLRLPSYLAAGAIRFPWRPFVLVTGLAAAGWVAAIFVAGHFLGVGRIPFLRDHAVWIVVGAVAVAGVSAMVRTRRGGVPPPCVASATPELPLRGLAGSAAGRRRSFGERIGQFEFWPTWVFYAPVALFYIWLGVRYRGWNLPAAANPGMPAGGLVGESKFDTLRLLALVAPESTAGTWLLAPGDVEARFAAVRGICAREDIGLPFILKPDVGQRGAGVKLIRSFDAALDYLAQVQSPVVLQRYAPGPREAGVFYYRLPDEPCGRILAITEKIFPEIEGDGKRTVEDLILADSRAVKIADTYLRRFQDRRDQVLARGETMRLVEAGNHAQGCIFRDGMHLATPELCAAIDRISQALPEFFIGRFDVRYRSGAELRTGMGFTIVELNGAGSEATSIYDEHCSLRSAYRMLYRQWELVFRIGAMNQGRGWKAESSLGLMREWRRSILLARSYPVAD